MIAVGILNSVGVIAEIEESGVKPGLRVSQKSLPPAVLTERTSQLV
jgi:hypothetical protein